MSDVWSWCRSRAKLLLGIAACYSVALTLVALANAASFDDLYPGSSQRQLVVNDGWTVYEDSKLIGEEVTLPHNPQNLKAGYISLERSLPDTGFASTVLVVYTYQNLLTVELDGKVLYKDDYRPNKMNKTPGSNGVMIALPDGYAGKTVTLRYDRVIPADTAGSTGVTLIDPLSGGSLAIFSDNALFFAMCALMMLGGVLLVFAVFYDKRQLLMRPLLYLALFAIFTSVWVLCNSKLMLFFTRNLVLIHNLEYISFFLFTLPVWAFLCTNWNKAPRFAMLGLGVMAAFYALAITLKVTCLVDFHAINWLYHTLLVTTVPFFVLGAWHGLRSNDLSLKIFYSGFVILLLTGVCDLVRFYFFPERTSILLVWGVVAMGLCVLISYLMSAKNRIEHDAEESVYKQLAYTDKLTGLANRLTFEEDVANISQDLGRYHSIVFVNTDVNCFKSINDTYGHVMGDQVLREIARVLHSTFSNVGRCYRMGGDEFCVIALDQDPRKVDALLGRVNGELDHAIVEFPVSIAYGLSEYNHFLHHSLMDVFKAADDLMYAHKRACHTRQ